MRIALMGAGGKMGCRITEKLKDEPDFEVAYVEVSEAGRARLADWGLRTTPQDEALSNAQVVILAIPDAIIGQVAQEIVPQLQPNTIVMGLDPAAAYAGVLPARDDITYFIVHPCHPPLFGYEADPAAREDWFGGTAVQDLVCSLHQGPEEHYAVGERLARLMFAPVRNAHRLTVEQMAMLEPALVETFTSTLIAAMKEGLDEVVRMGVPKAAAMDFLMGHLRVQFGVIFEFAGFPFSDGAKLAMARARDLIFRPDWKQAIFNLDSIRQSVAEITRSIAR